MPESLETRLKLGTDFKSNSECWSWKGGLTSHGYGRIMVNGKSGRLVHRIIYEILHGTIPKHLFVCHRCDNPRCVNPDHLFLGTNADNIKDAAIKNRMVHKLSLRDVTEIRRLYIEGFTQQKIADIFHINQSNVSRIIKKTRRPHV